MPSPVPFTIGSLTSAASSAAYAVTVTTASPAGNTVIVAADASGSTSVTSVTDTRGNTYTAGPATTASQWASLWYSVSAVRLSAADVITVTYGAVNSQQKNILVFSAAGYSAADPDSGSSHGSGTSPSALGGTSTGYSTAYAVFSNANAGGAPALQAGWTQAGQLHSGAGQYLTVAWQQQYAAGVFITPAASITSSAWACLVQGFEIPLPGLPAVPVFPAGFTPAPADMQTWITSPLGFCAQGIMFRAQQVNAQTFSGGTFSGNTIQFDTVLEDPYSGWNPGTYQWQAPFTGWYEVTLTVSFAAAGGTVITAVSAGGVRYAVSEMQVPAGNDGGTPASIIVPLTGGADTIFAVVSPSSGLSTSVSTAGMYPSVEIGFVSA